MNRRNRNNKIGWIILGIILFSIFGGGGFVGGLFAVFAGFILIMAAAIAILTKVLKGHDYAEVKKDNRPTANPYSSTTNRNTNQYSNNNRNIAQPGNAQTAAGTAGGAGGAPGKQGQNAGNPYSGYNTPPTPQQNTAPKPPAKERKSTGDPEIDKMIDEKDKAIAEMHRLNESIEDETLSAQIDHLESVTDKIVKYVVKHPNKKNQVKKFFNYYLPTTLKLLNAYDRMDEAGISGANIDGTKGKVEEMMGTALSAFDKQLDALFADEALDVVTDISVMENMLKSEGLMDDELMNEAKELVRSYSE